MIFDNRGDPRFEAGSIRVIIKTIPENEFGALGSDRGKPIARSRGDEINLFIHAPVLEAMRARRRALGPPAVLVDVFGIHKRHSSGMKSAAEAANPEKWSGKIPPGWSLQRRARLIRFPTGIMHPHEPALFAAYIKKVSNPSPRTRSTYTRPLRSWALALRANDKRIDTYCDPTTVDYHEWNEDSPLCAIDEIVLSAAIIKRLCGPISIPYPGVSIDEAARILGVNRTTIFRRARSQHSQLVIDYYCKRYGRDLHRAEKLVWTRSPINPNGDVWTVPWDEPRVGGRELHLNIASDWSQIIRRTHRPLATRVYSRFLQCPQCGSWNYILFFPQPIWTVGDQVGTKQSPHPSPSATADLRLPGERGLDGFVCRTCAKLIYESAERTSRPAPGRCVNVWDRYVKRATDGRLCGRDLDEPTLNP